MKNKAFKFRLYPTTEQSVMFTKTFGCCRKVYNLMLSDKIEGYKLTSRFPTVTPAKYKKDYSFLKEVDSLALANVQMDLQAAFHNAFSKSRKNKNGFPKFKSKKKCKKSYTTNNQNGSIRLIGNKVKLPKVGYVKLKLYRQIPKDYIIKSATISQTSTGKYYISILTEYEVEEIEINLDKSKAIGLDYSSPCFYIDNNGDEAGYPKYFRLYQRLLAKEQCKLSHMKLHSNNYEKQKIKVAKIHEKIANSRTNWLHNLSKNLCDTYDYIYILKI